MRLLLACLLLILAPLGAGMAQASTTDQVTTFSLDNGLEVVVIEDHRAPVVTQMLWYRAGSADEKPGVSGVAHFLEHLLFKGTKTLAPGEFSATVARNGGSDNAFTSYDYTAYFQRIAADAFDHVAAVVKLQPAQCNLLVAQLLQLRHRHLFRPPIGANHQNTWQG